MLRAFLQLCLGLAVLALLVGLAVPAAAADPVPVLVPAAAPAGTEPMGAAWYTVAGPDGRTMLVALYDPRPSPDHAVPAVLVLHGSHGFATPYVQIAHDLAEQTGYVVAAGCWFDGVGSAVVSTADVSETAPLGCLGGPEFVGATPSAWPAVRALGQAVRQHAGSAQLGLFGHARGAEVALQIASSPDPADLGIQAVVSSSGVYTALPQSAAYDTPTPLSLVEALAAPVLILHGQADAVVHAANATLYYQRLRSLNKPAQCVIYPRFGHDALLHTVPGDPQGRVFVDGVKRSAAFFKGAFGDAASIQSVDCLPG